ncbi:hypothetical protein [Fischerella thermalis]|uniref:hypothetical protein n=1 Tax=Fischerella thermalis TaxID=372787 RepID=UPI00307EB9ED
MALLYLAVRDSIFIALFEEPIGTLLIEINDKIWNTLRNSEKMRSLMLELINLSSE